MVTCLAVDAVFDDVVRVIFVVDVVVAVAVFILSRSVTAGGRYAAVGGGRLVRVRVVRRWCLCRRRTLRAAHDAVSETYAADLCRHVLKHVS